MSDADEPIRVLHVDDDREFTGLVATHLEGMDERFVVETATSVREAEEKRDGTAVDCIVSDYDMPGENGIEFLHAVRADDPDVPFILYTKKAAGEVASEAITAGATDYLRKDHDPSQYDLLANRIRNAVSQHRARKRADELDRIRALLGAVDRTLVRADSRRDVESRVCELLGDAAPYRFAWLGVTDAGTDRVESRAASGVGGGLDDHGVGTTDTPAGREAAETAVRERRVVVAEGVASPEAAGGKDASERDERAVAAVPLVHDETCHGVLVVGTNRRNAFCDAERAVLCDLGSDVAHKFHSLETRAELHEQRRFIEQALDVLGEVFYVIDTEGRLERWNRRLVEVTGYSDDAVDGMPAVEFFVDSDREAVADAIEETLATESAIVEATLLSADDEEIPYELSGARLTDVEGDVIGLIGVGRDLTERKRRESELKRQNERLTQLASVVSHDLRTPLTSAHSYVRFARSEPSEEYFDCIEASLERASRIVEDLLWLTRNDRDIGSTERLDLREQVASAWQIVAVDDGVGELVVADDLGSIRADEDRFRQVLENLFQNALTHADAGVAVTVGPLEAGDGFYVADDGPGIPTAERSRVFESGYTTASDGTGYGLAIVAEIVAAHDWTITVTESADGGARFEIRDVD